MKKLISLMIAVLLLVTCVVPFAVAVEKANVSVSSAAAATGENVTLSVSLSNNPGIGTYKMTVQYDSSELELISLKNGSEMSFAGNAATGEAAGMAGETVTANGTLFTATFKVLGTTCTKTNVSVSVDSFADIEGNSVPVSSSKGTVTISGTCVTTEVAEVPATCTKAGTAAHQKCTVCGKLYQDGKEVTASDLVIDALGHSYTTYVVDEAPTEKTTGKAHYECAVCGDKNGPTVELPKLDHVHVLTKVDAVAPTCGKDGNVEYYTCSDEDCKGMYFDAEGNLIQNVVLPATGKHTYENGICTVCGAKEAVAGEGGSESSKNEDKAVMPFVDVNKADWFYDDVEYVYTNGLMNGISATAFGPNQTTTRGMIVTILYRLEGSPAAGACTFEDVKDGAYYEDAIAWAAAKGIVTGYSATTFGPDDQITREQMAAILYRYAGFKGYDVSARADLSKYTDAGEISAYAEEAMSWANAEGLINGMSGGILAPQGSATRAQVAAILHRFCENVVK